jgi:F-type H+-transporting ATPase subunit alpha
MDGRPSLARMRATGRAALDGLRDDLSTLVPGVSHARVGRVFGIGDGVVRIAGLHDAFAGEVLEVGGAIAVAHELDEREVRAVLIDRAHGVGAGDVVRRTGRVLEVPAGPELIGRVVDPLGRPLDAAGPLLSRALVRVDGPSVPLAEREPVSRPLRTGIFAVDTMIPIGRGQRQLVIGDRATGKTELCLDMLCAMDPEVVGVYVAIGRRGAETATHLQWLQSHGVLTHGFAVVTDADDPPGLVHLTPYAACAMAESFAAAGRDVVIVYDDLTAHANVHRTLALLLGRPVGREAHPADLFYAHARVLERAAQYGAARGGGSLTALPIVETQLGDITSYVPTNLVSITDGQVRLDASLVAAGMVPGIDVALSVSRVGGKAQPPLLRSVAGSFKGRYAQFLELESFARFGTRLEPSAQAIVDWGRRVRIALSQPRGASLSWAQSVARLLLCEHPRFGTLDDHVAEVVRSVCDAVVAHRAFAALDTYGARDDAVVARLRAAVNEVLEARIGLAEAPP